jgi:hypothetical protein
MKTYTIKLTNGETTEQKADSVVTEPLHIQFYRKSKPPGISSELIAIYSHSHVVSVKEKEDAQPPA